MNYTSEALFLIVSVVLVTEVIFRVKIFLWPKKLRIRSLPLLNIIAPPHIEFNKEAGYSFLKNTNSLRISYKFGEPVCTTFWEINSSGNVGADTIQEAQNSNFKIAVFGDSFTECSGGVERGRTWPDYLKSIIRNSSGAEGLSVLNFGRGGYGILQMFDLMRLTIEKIKPDLIIFAFITDDLSRDRFWYSQLKTEKLNRFVVSGNAEFDPLSSEFTDVAYFLDSEQRDWLLENSTRRQQDDPKWKDIEKELNLINIRKVRNYGFSFRADFLLWNVLIYNTPFPRHKYRRFDGNPRLNFDNLMQDKRLTENIEYLKKSLIPFEVINIPRFEEFNGNQTIDLKTQNLRASLEKAIGKPISKFQDYPNIPTSDIEKYYALPHDLHPSQEGLKLISEIVYHFINKHL